LLKSSCTELPNPGHVLAVLDRLEKCWHMEENPPHLRHEEPLDGLILTVLSQNTNDKNRDRGYVNLRKLFPSWESVATASSEDIREAIRVAGLSDVKSKRILEILEQIYKAFGAYSLKSLREKSSEEAKFFLLHLPGVGAKTTACVLLFDLGFPSFPVDTHISRFSKRVGWVKERCKPEEIGAVMEQVVPENRYLGGHVNIITHGRNVCLARTPRCSQCSVADLCVFAGKLKDNK
jgi:endonuclease-3